MAKFTSGMSNSFKIDIAPSLALGWIINITLKKCYDSRAQRGHDDIYTSRYQNWNISHVMIEISHYVIRNFVSFFGIKMPVSACVWFLKQLSHEYDDDQAKHITHRWIIAVGVRLTINLFGAVSFFIKMNFPFFFFFSFNSYLPHFAHCSVSSRRTQ